MKLSTICFIGLQLIVLVLAFGQSQPQTVIQDKHALKQFIEANCQIIIRSEDVYSSYESIQRYKEYGTNVDKPLLTGNLRCLEN